MKKLALSALFVMLFIGSAAAHNGSLGLFLDGTLGVCNAPLGNLETDTIMMYYIRSSGPDLGRAVEFRLELSSVLAIIAQVEWNPLFVQSLGNYLTGITMTSTTCIGGDQPSVYIGTIYILNFGSGGPGDKFYVSVKEDPGAIPPGIYITGCSNDNPIYSVLGGQFVFNGDCSTGVKETSWGAIKELYR